MELNIMETQIIVRENNTEIICKLLVESLEEIQTIMDRYNETRYTYEICYVPFEK